MATPPLPPPVDQSELLKVFEVLGIKFSTGPATERQEDLVLSLSHGLIGAAEQHAMRAEQAARAAGATIGDIGEATGQAFNAAGCRNIAEDIALLSWRAQRGAQAVGQGNKPDELMKTVELVAAALSGLLSAAQTMRNSMRGERDTKDAARAVRASAVALDKALTSGPGLKVLADLLDATD